MCDNCDQKPGQIHIPPSERRIVLLMIDTATGSPFIVGSVDDVEEMPMLMHREAAAMRQALDEVEAEKPPNVAAMASKDILDAIVNPKGKP